LSLILSLAILFLSAGCSPDSGKNIQFEDGTPVAVYYLKDTSTEIYLVREVHRVSEAGTETNNLARAALEELINGEPVTEGARRVLPPETELIGISIKDGLALVNFSQEVLLANVGSAEEALGIQSIVNTLTEFENVDEVSFMVEGETGGRVMDWWGHVGLYEQPFKRNLSNAF